MKPPGDRILMKIELTDDEVTTVLVALDNYRDRKEVAWLTDGFESDQNDAGSAEWVWQKIHTQREVDRINAEIRAGSTLSQQTFAFNTQVPESTSASVDPFDLSGYDDMGGD